MKRIKIILVLILLFFSIEYVGFGPISVYRVVIFPLSLWGFWLCQRYKKEVNCNTAIALTVLYFSIFFVCYASVGDDNMLFTIFIMPLFLFLYSVWYMRIPIIIDYAKIFVWYFLPHAISFLTGTATYDEGRFAGFHEDPNFCGLFLSFSIFSAVLLIGRKDTKRKMKIVYLVCLLSSSVMLFMTGSRGALLSTLLLFAYIFYMKAKIRVVWKVLSIIILVFGLNALWNYILSLPDWVSPYESFVDSFLCRFKPDSMTSGSGRDEIWSTIFDRIQFEGAYFFPIGSEKAMQGTGFGYAHNTFLEFLITQGVVMGIISVFMLFVLLVKANKKRKGEYEKGFYYCCVSVMLQLFFLSAISQKIFWICVFFLVYLTTTKKSLSARASC